jgi:hypothetical protein
VLLRLEGVALLVGTIVVYFDQGYAWWLLIILALAPDLSMVGYLVGARVGAITYNAAHTSVFPVALGTAGVLAGSGVAIELALIWLAHIGADRALGYGMKYSTGFKDTHLQRV